MALHDTHAYCGVTVSKGQQKLEGRWVRATAILSSMSKERVTGRIDDIVVGDDKCSDEYLELVE